MKVKNRLLVKACIEEINPKVNVISPLFYKELFRLDVRLENVFSGNVVFLNRKFINMLGTFKNVKHLEAISDSLHKMGERHADYGAEFQHFPLVKTALLTALRGHLGERYTEELHAAWQDVFNDVAAIMEQAVVQSETTTTQHRTETAYDTHLFEEIGSTDVIRRVHQRFYDVLFEEPWLEKFFYGKAKDVLISKQTEFMTAAFGGPHHYTGDTPAFVHMHMFITDEMSDVREVLLKKAILTEGLSASVAERWLKVDRSFRPAIVKKSVHECVLKCVGQLPVVAEKPANYIAPY